jgi:AbiV family abortive infection protein
MSDTTARPISSSEEDKNAAAMRACVDHAHDLLESGKAVQASGKPHIAYHLATLALEELGRRALLAVENLSSQEPVPPAWPAKHTQDHVQKLFWAFFGANFLGEQITKERLEGMQTLARVIHAKRLAGLYVESREDGLSLPSEAIDGEECARLIGLAETRLEMARSEVLRTDITDEDREYQKWFLAAAEDPERRRYLFTGASMKKLAELHSAREWVRWLKEQFDNAERESRAAMEKELQRSQNLPAKRTKDKWKMRVRIFCDSHSIRPKTLSLWNDKSDWIKLVSVSGKKNQLILEFTFGDNVPVEGLWFFGWGVARHLVVALNIGSMGFWWWRMPEQISRYYESIEDLETNAQLGLERNPSLKIDWGPHRVFTDADLARVAQCFAALPGPNRRDRHGAYNYYIGGITFLSLNDVHWQCEVQAYGNFHESLKAMMKDAGDWNGDTPYEERFIKFLDELFPSLDERERFLTICRAYEGKRVDSLGITLKEVSFIKLFCDAYFLRTVAPAALKELPIGRGADEEPDRDDVDAE